jgi:hypothetical protein
MAGQSFFGAAHVSFVLTARFARNHWKYRGHDRAYAGMLMDAAHLSQTLYLSARTSAWGVCHHRDQRRASNSGSASTASPRGFSPWPAVARARWTPPHLTWRSHRSRLHPRPARAEPQAPPPVTASARRARLAVAPIPLRS